MRCGHSSALKGDMTLYSHPIRLLLADVDGTLVTGDKVLTERSVATVAALRDAGILFAVTSGRPPRGMSTLIETLDLTTPIAAFNGALFIRPDMSVIEQRLIPDDVAAAVIELLDVQGMGVWAYRDMDWLVPDIRGAHVAHEASTVGFEPTLVGEIESITQRVAKVVGVSDDYDAVQTATALVRKRFGDSVSAARSQPYYLDITNPRANKGAVVRYRPQPTTSLPNRSPRSATCRTTSACSSSQDSASRWVTRATRSNVRHVVSPRQTKMTALRTPWSNSSLAVTPASLKSHEPLHF